MNHAVPWDLNALWELAGRATAAGACRSPGVTAGFDIIDVAEFWTINGPPEP